MELPPSYREVIDPIVATARGFVEAGQSLVPFAFVGRFSAGQPIPIRIETSDEEAKDRSAQAIQRAARETNADFILTIMEAWGLPKDKVSRHQEILDRYGSIANCPYRVDTASFVLETRHGVWAAQVPLKPRGISKKKRTFDDVILQFVDSGEGRFTGLLPESDKPLPGAAMLH